MLVLVHLYQLCMVTNCDWRLKIKGMFMPRGCRVLHLKIRRPSDLRLSLVLWRPARTTATIISSVVWPGEEKCIATGRSAFFETDRRCSQNLSPSLRPVSPTYDRVHARQVMIYTRLLVMHENLCRMVRGPPGVLIWEAGLVWSQVLHRGRRQGKFITFFILHTLTHANELMFLTN